MALFYLITEKVTLYPEQRSIAGLATALVVGIVLLVGGYKASKWLRIDRPPLEDNERPLLAVSGP